MRRILKWLGYSFLLLVLIFTIFTYFYVRLDKFGATPSGERLARMQRSPHYQDGKFQNLQETPQLTEGHSIVGVMMDFMFTEHPRTRPVDSIPSMKTDLLALPIDSNLLVWFGHSSYFIQLDGKRILSDPVFSGNASPIPGTNTSFAGTERYSVEDLPEIDYLFLTHDHYDHVDYETLTKLQSKVKYVVCGLGVGAHFEQWGYRPEQILEKDWDERIRMDSVVTIYTTPARHFSGRGFTRDNTLWMSYVVQTPSMKIYIGGDSGYGKLFSEIGKKYGPIDLAILEDGQYDLAWKYIHLLPAEVLQAATDLKAKRLFPVHSSKFAMANHPWDEPLIEITRLNQTTHIPLVTPIIGEVVNLNDSTHTFKEWWNGIK